MEMGEQEIFRQKRRTHVSSLSESMGKRGEENYADGNTDPGHTHTDQESPLGGQLYI